MIHCKGIVLGALWGAWLTLSVAHEYHDQDMDSPLISHQKESDLLSQLEHQKIAFLQKQLKQASFTHSVYRSAFQELEDNLESLNIAYKNIHTFLAELKPILEGPQESSDKPKEQFMNLIHRLGFFYPHPAIHTPLISGLKEVPGYFPGTVNLDECKGLFSGVVRGAEAVMTNNQWKFTLSLGDQIFTGILKREAAPGKLILTSTNRENQLVFPLSSEFLSHWSDPQISSAWRKLVGIKGEDWPAVFYSSSRSIPEGIEISTPIPSPLAIYYKKTGELEPSQPLQSGISYYWEKLVKMIWGESSSHSREVGRFLVCDQTPGFSGKIVFDSSVNKSMVLQAPSGVMVKINPSFDFNTSWDKPLILWDRYQPKMTSAINFRISQFDDRLQERVIKFDVKPVWQALEKIVVNYLTNDLERANEVRTFDDLVKITNTLEESLKVLSQRKQELVNLLSKNQSKIEKIYLETKMLLSNGGEGAIA